MIYLLNFSEINWLAVGISLILSFVLGAVWHSVFFKKIWTADSGTKYNSQNHGNPLLIFGLSAVLHLVSLVGLALLLQGASAWTDGLFAGLIISLVWVSASMGVTYVFAGRSFRLFLVDAGFYVVFLTMAAIILAVWK